MKYRQGREEVEAIQFQYREGMDIVIIVFMCGGDMKKFDELGLVYETDGMNPMRKPDTFNIRTEKGLTTVKEGDWFIRKSSGETHLVSDQEFKALYEKID